jgi:hypothetical protein
MRARIVAAAVVAVLVGGACGSSGGAGSTDLAKLLSDSTARTRQSSERVAIDVRISSPQLPNPAHITGSGEFNNAAHRGVITEQIPDLSGGGSGTQEIEIREIGQTLYVRAPGAGTPGKPWIETDASTFGAQSGSFDSSDPTQFLDYLQGASSGITDRGDDTIRGDHTRKLAVRIDLRKAAAKLGPQQQQAIEQAIQQLGTSTLPAQVWIDDGGRLRKMSFSFHIQQNGQRADLTVSLELFDFGVQVDVEAPPKSQVSQSGQGGM